MKQDKEIKL